MTPWTVAHQAPPSMGFSRQEYLCYFYLKLLLTNTVALKMYCVFVCVSHLIMSDSLWPHGLYTPGLSVHRILQARILEWIAISFFRGSSWPGDWTCISCIFFISRQIVYHAPPGKPLITGGKAKSLSGQAGWASSSTAAKGAWASLMLNEKFSEDEEAQPN